MVIHSIISMEDIFCQPDYSINEKPENQGEQINCDFLKTSNLNGYAKAKNIFSTDPSVYLKYMI